jgi:hypothetical protein
MIGAGVLGHEAGPAILAHPGALAGLLGTLGIYSRPGLALSRALAQPGPTRQTAAAGLSRVTPYATPAATLEALGLAGPRRPVPRQDFCALSFKGDPHGCHPGTAARIQAV